MGYILIFIQNINILLNGFETGTQGSIDGYIISLYLGIILSIVIILVQIFYKNNLKKGVKIINIIFLNFSLSLYVNNFDYLLYVTIKGYSINDVIIGTIGTEAVGYAKNIGERIYPIIFFIMITINVIICIITIFSKNNEKI
jgi:heme/copper-type cytochrome/quinol oxidase subunit 4